MTEVFEKRAITTSADFPYPVETLWRAMTDSEWLAVWFFPNDIQPMPGHGFTIWSRPIERWDGEFRCEVLEASAPRLLKFRWTGGHEELKAFGKFIDTVVTWTLAPLPDGAGTTFTFVHEGFSTDPATDAVFEVMGKGSQSVLRSLARRLPDLIAHGA